VHTGVALDDGRTVTRELVDELVEQELAELGAGYAAAAALFRQVALADAYEEFLTVPAYEQMP
jgi:malate synthase